MWVHTVHRFCDYVEVWGERNDKINNNIIKEQHYYGRPQGQIKH